MQKTCSFTDMQSFYSTRILGRLMIYSALAAILFFSSCSSSKVGEKAPEINAVLMNGKSFDLDLEKGNYVMLSFWGSWCGPCLKQSPQLISLVRKYENQTFNDGSGFEIVSIAIEKNDRRTQAAIDKFGYYWPKHIMEVSRFVMQAPLALKYGITDLPTKVLVGPDGNVILKKATLEQVDAYLSEKL